VTRFLPFILRSTLRNKRRTVLTILSIVISLFLFCTLRTVITSLAASLESASSTRLITRRSTSLTFMMPVAYADRIAQVPGVEDVSWMSWFGGIYIDERNFFAQFAVDPQSYLDMYPEYRLEPEEKDTFRLHRRREAGAQVRLRERRPHHAARHDLRRHLGLHGLRRGASGHARPGYELAVVQRRVPQPAHG
jgi:hypothetical protein